MRGCRAHDDADLAQRHDARAVDDRQARHPEALFDLSRDRAQHVESHLIEDLVLKSDHGLACVPGRFRFLARRRGAGAIAGLSEEEDDGTVGGRWNGAPQLCQQLVVDRVDGYLEADERVGGGAACDGWNQGQLVAVRERFIGRGVLAVAREAHAVALGRERRRLVDEELPRVSDRGPLRELDLALAPTGLLAEHREQSDLDRHSSIT